MSQIISMFASSVIQNQEEKKKYRWKVSFTVLLLFIFGAIINLPFSREVKNLAIEAGKKDITLNESILSELLTIGISSLIVGAILVFIGLWFSSNANLGAPLIARYFSNKPMSGIIERKAILSSIFLSVIIALILLVLFEIQSELYPVPNKLPRPSKLYYLIVAFSAGITEEIMFRLGLMSFIVTVIHFFKREENPGNRTVWTAIIISALFFGLMHLPLSKNFVDLTPFTIAVTMLGNLITGSTFGWIFWKRGLLVAILSHIVFDLVFHVIGSPYT
jgi:membrane protease YdiL (CAAX protease family)